MKWNKYRLKTTTEAEDIVSSMLMELGIQGVEIEDKIRELKGVKTLKKAEVEDADVEI